MPRTKRRPYLCVEIPNENFEDAIDGFQRLPVGAFLPKRMRVFLQENVNVEEHGVDPDVFHDVRKHSRHLP